MREIEFRGKEKDNDEWIYGSLLIDETQNSYVIVDNQEGIGREVNPETIGQYTGLKDKNGKKIFEGDIVKWADYTMEIFWGEDIGIGYGFCWRPCGSNRDYQESMTGFIDEYEVIGNIYDNPELLKEEL